METLEQALLVAALVAACYVAYRLLSRGERRPEPPQHLVQIDRPKARRPRFRER